MLRAILEFSLKHRFAVIATSFLILGMALYHLQSATYDVFPEFAPPQVIVQTEAPGFSSEQVETLISQVIEKALGGANGITDMRSTSIQGLSAVQIFFDLHSDILVDRQIISERLADISSLLPAGIKPPKLGPLVSTTHIVVGIGLTSEKLNLTELRTIADWQIRPQILGVSGIADTESYGGFFRQIQIQVKPDKLKTYGLSFDDVMNAARRATGIRGAGVIDTEQQRITMSIATDAETLDNIAKTPLTRGNGETLDLSITLSDVATIVDDHQTPFGAASIMGKPGVLLLAISQYGANTLDVTKRLEELLYQMKPALEKQGIIMRSDLIRPASFIETSLQNMQHALWIGAALVTMTLLIFLWNIRAALISALAIPFSLIIAAVTLNVFGISLNIMSIGGLAIAVGLVVDDAVIDVENILRHLRGSDQNNKLARYKILLAASLEVRVPVIVATIAVLLISIPIMTLSGIGGRLFAPLGIAYATATLFSLVVALTLTPALCMVFLKENKAQAPALTQWLQRSYISILRKSARLWVLLVCLMVVATVAVGIGFSTLKTEFLPELHEGHFILHMEAAPGASLQASTELGNQVTASLLKLPFIDAVVQQIGRTENGIDFWGTQSSEFNIALKPNSGMDESVAKDKILQVLDEFKDNAEFELETFLTERMQEVISGHTAEASLNVYGEDLNLLEKVSENLAAYLKTVPEIRDVQIPAKTGTPQLDITLSQSALLKWGLNPVSVLDTIHTAYQGEVVGQIYDLHHPTDLAVILDGTTRNNIDDVGSLPILTPSGDYIALNDVAKIERKAGRYLIEHESGRRVQSITFNMNKHSKHVLLKHLRAEIGKINLPPGVYTSIVSLAEEQVNASKQLMVHSGIAMIAIVILLSLVMHHHSQIWLVLANTPLALAGGVVALFFTQNSLSLGAIVGFVTLIGITLRNSVLMIAHYNHVVEHEKRKWDTDTAFTASAERLLPILMTAIVTGIGLLPIALNSGQSGHEIEGPMAIVIIGGLISSTILNLLFLPILSLRFGQFRLQEIEG